LGLVVIVLNCLIIDLPACQQTGFNCFQIYGKAFIKQIIRAKVSLPGLFLIFLLSFSFDEG